MIDITSGIFNVPVQMNKCKAIASSSLHGLILADAYGIPSVWIKMSDNVIGGSFKFLDYFLSVGRGEIDPITVNSDISVESIIDSCHEPKINIDQKMFTGACPFVKVKQGNIF